jgi:hypothetical protein
MEGAGGTWRPWDPVPCQPPRPRSALVRGSVHPPGTLPHIETRLDLRRRIGEYVRGRIWFGASRRYSSRPVSLLRAKARAVPVPGPKRPSYPRPLILPEERPHGGERWEGRLRRSHLGRAIRAPGRVPHGPAPGVGSSPLSCLERPDKYVATLVQAGRRMRIGCRPKGPGRRFRPCWPASRGWPRASSPSGTAGT